MFRLRNGRSKTCGSIPHKDERFFSSLERPEYLWGTDRVTSTDKVVAALSVQFACIYWRG